MKIKVFLLFICCFFLCGCWNYKELSDYAIVTGMGIDLVEDDYQINLMIANAQSPETSSKEGATMTSVFTGKGKNISEAIKKVESQNPKKLYMAHLAVVIVSEKVAEKNLYDIIDPILRNPETARKFYIILARENSSLEVLKTLSPLESFPSQNIALNIRSSSSSEGVSSDVFLSEFMIKSLNPGFEGILPSITIRGDIDGESNQDDLKEVEPKSTLELKSIGIFKEGQLLGWTTDLESQGINLINNSVDTMTLTNDFEDNEYVVTHLSDLKVEKKMTFKNGKPSVEISVKCIGAIVETNRITDLTEPKVIKKIQQKTENNLKEIVEKGIEAAQEKFKSDVLGYGNLLYKKNYRYWNSVKEKWNEEEFSKVDTKVSVQVELKTKGSLETSIKEKAYEK